VEIESDHVIVARHHLYWQLYRAWLTTADNAKGAQRDAALSGAREAQAVLDRIGWPGADDHGAEVDLEMLVVIRKASLIGLQRDANNLAMSIGRSLDHPGIPFDWDHERTLDDMDSTRRLLDDIGWELV
jgi:hypothetical protein